MINDTVYVTNSQICSFSVVRMNKTLIHANWLDLTTCDASMITCVGRFTLGSIIGTFILKINISHHLHNHVTKRIEWKHIQLLN